MTTNPTYRELREAMMSELTTETIAVVRKWAKGSKQELLVEAMILEVESQRRALDAAREQIKRLEGAVDDAAVSAEMARVRCMRCWDIGTRKPHDSTWENDAPADWDAKTECPKGGSVPMGDTGEYSWACGCDDVPCECEKGQLIAANARIAALTAERDAARGGTHEAECRKCGRKCWTSSPGTVLACNGCLFDELRAERDAAVEPMQPVIIDEDGTPRFRENKIVGTLLDTGKLNLNDLTRMAFSGRDWMQFAQLIGYSISGYGELNYVTDESCERAAALAAAAKVKGGER